MQQWLVVMVTSCKVADIRPSDYTADRTCIRMHAQILVIDFGQAIETVQHHPSVRVNQGNGSYIMQACNQRWFKINTADSAQPRNRS